MCVIKAKKMCIEIVILVYVKWCANINYQSCSRCLILSNVTISDLLWANGECEIHIFFYLVSAVSLS